MTTSCFSGEILRGLNSACIVSCSAWSRRFKGLAEDQSWLEDLLNFHPVSGLPKKTFTFGWSHSVKLAQDAGCGPFRGETKDGGWDHVCVVTWRSSKSGGTTLSSPGYRFSQEHHDKGRLHRPSVADIKAYLREEAGKQPPEYHGGEL